MLKQPRVLLAALYSLAYLPLLFQKGIYWDAWMWIPEMFTYRNFEWMYVNEFAPLRAEHYYLIFRPLADSPDPILTAHLIIFFSWLAAGLLVYTILNRFLQLSERTSFFLAAYYLVFPAFITRFEIVSGTYYSTANLAFVLASYLYLAPPTSRVRTIAREATSLALFVWSFLCNSFPVYFFGFLAAHGYTWWRSHPNLSLWQAVSTYPRRYFYLPLLSVGYVLIKLIYLKPYGIGEHYNELLIARSDLSLVSIIAKFVDSFWGGLWAGFMWPFAASLSLLDRKYYALAFAIVLALLAYLVRRARYYSEDVHSEQPLALIPFIKKYHAVLPFLIGAGFIFLGLFPYAMAGKAPHIYGYGFAQRLSLLFPLGSAITIVAFVHQLMAERFRHYAHIALLSLCISFLWYNSFLEDMDWYKQQAILHEIPKVVTAFPPPATFVLYDDTRGLNWLNRTIADQEYSGYFRELTGSREYRGVNYFDWGKEVGATSTATIRITSRRPDEARVSDWIILKWTELTSDTVTLRNLAHDRLQIVLQNETTKSKEF